MAETDRKKLMKQSRQFVFEGEFIQQVFLGCFLKRVYVVIRQGSLYLYHSPQDYRNDPDNPFHFFNINSMKTLLDKDSVQISNHFTSFTLRHQCPERLIDLIEAINHKKSTISPEELYPKKYISLDSEEFKSEISD